MEGGLEGEQIGRYSVGKRIGGGGVATVYQATDQVSGQKVALKVLPPNPDSATLDRFRREALMAGALRHPNIVRILQVGTAGDGVSAYIAMDLVEGESLASLLARISQAPAAESCQLLAPIARALAYAHSQGVVHRDVKPSNILLRPSETTAQTVANVNSIQLSSLDYPVVPLLSDFGIARFLDAPELTNEGRTVGTPAFMAPEQCMGSREIDGRADIYSLGTVLYRCVTGRLPFSGSTTQILHAHVFEPVTLDDETIHKLPVQVIEILRQALAKTPEERYQSAEVMADQLAEAAASALPPAVAQAVDATSTTTMSIGPFAETMHASANGAQILVPGTASVEVNSRLARPVPKPVKRDNSILVNGLWAALFLILLGAILWNVRSFFDHPEAQRASLPPVILVTFTPTVTATTPPDNLAIEINSQPSTEVPAAAMPESTTVVAPSPTIEATAKSTPQPALTDTPAPLIGEVATAPSVPSIDATVALTPTEEIASACTTVVDEFFLSTVAALTSEEQANFACPTKPAEIVIAQWMPFANGEIVAIEGSPLAYIYYSDGSWEQEASDTSGDVEGTPQSSAPDQAQALPPRFAQILGSRGREVALGAALQAGPLPAETLMQPFSDGLILGNIVDGKILLLARSKLRF